MDYKQLAEQITDVANDAAVAILAIYNRDEIEVENKHDDSPLTKADMAAHDLILERLERLTPEIPVLSEEAADVDRTDWNRFWLVDPLDGTKEFIKRNGEFTVNIALVENGVPVLGIVNAPALDTAYIGYGDTAYKITSGDKTKISAEVGDSNSTKIVASRSHRDEDTDAFIEQFDNPEILSIGSSLKLCMVAEGKAHIYPRLAPTMEWDTAAGDAIVRAAGGRVSQLNGKTLEYNKQDLHNPFFVVTGSDAPDWHFQLPDSQSN